MLPIARATGQAGRIGYVGQLGNNSHKIVNAGIISKRTLITDIAQVFGVSTSAIKGLLTFTSVSLFTVYAGTRFKVAQPNEYLVRTGPFDTTKPDNIKISKQMIHWPFHTFGRIIMEPHTYHCDVENATSSDFLSFTLPAVYTIGPIDTEESLRTYAKYLINSSDEDLRHKILGIIQGETRVAASNMAFLELVNDRDKLKNTIVNVVNDQLKQFGLRVYNANIHEMQGNTYLDELRKRALEKAKSMANVGVAEQVKEGTIGEKRHMTEQRKEVAELEKVAKLVENERLADIEKSNAEFAMRQAEYIRDRRLKEAAFEAEADKARYELQKLVEEKKQEQEIARLRAEKFAIANVEAEVTIRESQGKAEAALREAQGKADAILAIAKAEAEAIQLKANAEAQGLENLVRASGSVQDLVQYLSVRDEVIIKLTKAQAEAVKDMKPTVNYWNTGSNEKNGFSNIINDLVKTGYPLLQGLKDQTGVDLLQSFKSTPTNQTFKTIPSKTKDADISPN